LKEDGKMKDQVLKQQVKKSIRPLMVLLQLINLISLIFSWAHGRGMINSSDLDGYVFCVIIILNSLAILYVVSIETKVTNDQEKQERLATMMKGSWVLVSSIGLIVVGIMTFILIKDGFFATLGGAFCGVGASLLLIHLVLKYKR